MVFTILNLNYKNKNNIFFLVTVLKMCVILINIQFIPPFSNEILSTMHLNVLLTLTDLYATIMSVQFLLYSTLFRPVSYDY